MPVYNGSRFIDEALRSIRAQTHTDFALVVSDNASTDDTREIVAAHAREDERITLLESDVNRGAAWNYNRVFEACRSPYFKWAAADDMLAPTCVERCLEELASHGPEVALVFPITRYVDEDGAALRDFLDPLATPRGASPHARLRHVVAHAVHGNLVFALMRSQALAATRRHGAFPSADIVLFAELALVGEFRAVEEPLFLRRMHAGMSRNLEAADIWSFMDPAADRRRGELTTVFVEHLRGIAAAPLPAREKALCFVVFLRTWARRRIHVKRRLARLSAAVSGRSRRAA